MGRTFAMKALGRAAGKEVEPGEIVFVEPDMILSHDNSSAIIGKFESTLPGGKVRYPDRLAIVLDHVIPAASSRNAADHAVIRKFVKDQGIEKFFDIGEGICHQVLPEKGLCKPGSIVVGSDSHTCTYGAFNCFATGIDRTETAGLWITGKTWFRVPESMEINLFGHLEGHASAKDLILTLIGMIGADGASYMAVEFHGPAVGTLRISERMTVANMGIEMGAKIAVFPADGRTRDYFLGRGPGCEDALWSDVDAPFTRTIDIELNDVVPVVALPHRVDDVVPISDLEPTPIDQVLLGTCTNGRIEDLVAAAGILKGRRISRKVRMIVNPASREVYLEAIERDLLRQFIESGAVVIPPGCGPCLGAHMGALAPGERCLSTANRNFRGRMGEKEAEIYLGSPETAAASAITGEITDPGKV
jgi:homoaconitate hydratase family protein